MALGLDALRSTRAIRTAGRDAGRDQRGVRPDRLREDRRRARHDRGLRRPRGVPRGRVVVPDADTRSSNAAGEDFWTEMTRVTEKPVNRIMKSFVDQPGAPMLSVQTRCVGGDTRGHGARSSASSARRPRPTRGGARSTWTLPVCVKTGTGSRHLHDRHRQPPQTFDGAGMRRGVRQRRCARLLLHRVRAGGRGARWPRARRR